MSFSIYGITNLGIVTDEQNKIINNVFQMGVPLSSTSQMVVSNIFGKKRLITIQAITIGSGYSVGTVAQNINAFIADVEEWTNSGSQSRRLVTDSFGNSYECICIDFTWTRSQTHPNLILYSMTLLEGGFGDLS